MNYGSPLKMVIVGGGTAGWMSAAILAHSLKSQPVDVVLLESALISTVGVGEGSTPALKTLFDQLGITEQEWMPRCNATYKCGITFEGWSTKPGFSRYYHPFASQIDSHTLPLFIANAQARLRGFDTHAHPNRYFLSARLADNHLAPKPHYNFPFEVHYGYHFDAALLGQFLKEKVLQMGVAHQVGTVVHINSKDNGGIASLLTDEGEKIEADFFIDCSGFNGLLIQQHLKTPFESYGNALFNDSAVAFGTKASEVLPSQTTATALMHGWAWKIPLASRTGNGYVYSSHYCSADEAELELREHLGAKEADVDVRHLKMKVGRVKQHWSKNCLAVGLSQGFIEPLEATALFLVQQTVALFVDYFGRGNFTDKHQNDYNKRINEQFDGVRDYVVTHYKTNSRDDTEYWRDARANPDDISQQLRALYQCWMSGKDLAAEVKRQKMDRFYPVPSWYCIFAGMGIFPSRDRLNAVAEPNAMEALDHFVARCALNYDSHREVLSRMREAPVK
ncbi:tryptophan halogenase family protein [Teredinibacter haidensis]|uniref:tryptophan halogenase family protein n=1 Tax=Teredinibacter haidensis TaxID=2731755 RepID=UPI0009491044|nr:tryptophan halogenase family protein [Teredinibacter haidensis]